MTEKKVNIDYKSFVNYRTVIFVGIIALIIYPTINPIGIPVTIHPEVRAVYEYINSLPEGSTVMFSLTAGPAFWGELGPGEVTILNHIFSRPLRLVIWAASAESLPVIERSLLLSNIRQKQYGVDYVNLGYMPGGEVGYAKIRDNLHILAKDNYGTPLEDLPMMEDLKTVEDIDFLMVFGQRLEPLDNAIRQFGGYVPIGMNLLGGVVSSAYPYYQSDQLVGILPSVRGAAEYDRLVGIPSLGTKMMDAIGTTHAFILLLFIYGNYTHLRGRIKEAES